MKRVPLTQLRRILRPGDYVGYNKDSFYMVNEIKENGFSYVSRSCYYYMKFDENISTWNKLYWLPGDLLESTDTIAKIKRARLKEGK